jgi:phosphate transport system permease protein
MSSSTGHADNPATRARVAARTRLRIPDSVGDKILHGVCLVASLLTVAVIVAIAYQLLDGARPAMSRFGFGFLTHSQWRPNFGVFGAETLLYGTVVTSAIALMLAMPIGVSIGLYLSELAPRGVRGIVGPLVEMLAAIPSVILGFWGILVLSPFVNKYIEPSLHHHVGFIPIFGALPTTGNSVFTASLILAIMIVPIVASISRDLFLTVPRELKEGAAALGATRWEIVRGVDLPSTASGVVAAGFLGLGRALGEAIAVTQVIGAGTAIHRSLFLTGDTLASRVAEQFQGTLTALHTASLFYLTVVLLAIGLVANLTAMWISRHFDYQHRFSR